MCLVVLTSLGWARGIEGGGLVVKELNGGKCVFTSWIEKQINYVILCNIYIVIALVGMDFN